MSTKGNKVKLKLTNKTRRDKTKCKSKFQYETGEELALTYPHDIIFEEVRIPEDNFILDFFIPSLKLVVECHGRQHTEHVKHFHKTRIEFHKQQDIDRKKREWCKLNGFRLVEIYYE